jgi:hypothetical protein
VFSFLLNLSRMIPLARSHGFDIHFSRCKIWVKQLWLAFSTSCKELRY